MLVRIKFKQFCYRLGRLTNRKEFEFWLVLALTLLALLIRLDATGAWNEDRPNSAARLKGDERDYNSLALSILEGEGFNWPGRVPLYPSWLAGAHRLTRGSYSGIVYVQVWLGAAVIPLLYVLGRRLFDRATAAISAFLAAISYILIHQSLHLQSEVLYTPLILLVAITLWDASQKPSAAAFGWAGFWVGASNLARPMLLLFPMASLLLLLVTFDRRQALRYWIVYVVTSFLIVTPWVVRNYVHYHALFPLQTSKAILWQGSPEYYHLVRDQGYTYERVWNEVIFSSDPAVPDPTTVEGDRWWTRRALRSIKAEPIVYLKYAVEKTATYWIGDPNGDWGDTYVFNYQALRDIGFKEQDAKQYMIARILPIITLLAALMVRNKWRSLLPIYALLLYCTLLHAVTHAEARLSDPLQPFLLILVTGAFIMIGNTLRSWLSSLRPKTAVGGDNEVRASTV